MLGSWFEGLELESGFWLSLGFFLRVMVFLRVVFDFGLRLGDFLFFDG